MQQELNKKDLMQQVFFFFLSSIDNIFMKQWVKTVVKLVRQTTKQLLTTAEADSGLAKLVVKTNVFFNNQQHEIKTRQFIYVKKIKSSFFSNNGNRLFYSKYM